MVQPTLSPTEYCRQPDLGMCLLRNPTELYNNILTSQLSAMELNGEDGELLEVSHSVRLASWMH